MRFTWDEAKNRSNIAKHGVSFELASRVFEGFTLDAADIRFDYGEERIISVGIADGVVILAVVHTDRDGAIRIISARRANRKERARYVEAIRPAFDG